MGKKIPEKLFKTTIVIWTEFKADDAASSDPDGDALVSLAHDACHGDAYCSKFDCVEVENPEADPDWDGTEFFGEQREVENPFACPGCGAIGTPEETRDGQYLVRCKEAAGCDFDDAWYVPVPALKLVSGGTLEPEDDNAAEALGMLQSEGEAAIRQVDAEPFLVDAFVNARPVGDEDDSETEEDSPFAAWCRVREVGTDSREAWKEWRDTVEPRIVALHAEVAQTSEALAQAGGRGIDLAEEIDDLNRRLENLEAGRDEDDDGGDARMFEFGAFAVEWEWIGEGRSGDYDEDDPSDAKMLRATLHVRDEDEPSMWEVLDEGSYCTLAQVGTPLAVLKKMSLDLVNENGGPDAPKPRESFSKRRTQEWTWRTLWPDEDKGTAPPEHADCQNAPCTCEVKS